MASRKEGVMKYSPWYWHNKALREHPEYQMEGMLDCLREEMMLNMPVAPNAEFMYQESNQPEWTKRQWSEVQQLKAQVLFLSNKVNKMRAKASKRKTKYV